MNKEGDMYGDNNWPINLLYVDGLEIRGPWDLLNFKFGSIGEAACLAPKQHFFQDV